MFVSLRFVPHDSEASAVAGRVSEPQDVVSDFSFAEKQSFLRWGWLASGDLPLVHAHGRTTVILV